MKINYKIYNTTVLLLCIFFMIENCFAVEPSTGVLKVKVANVKFKKVPIPVHTSGRISTSSVVKLSFKIGGIVDKIYVNEGQPVKKGELLARLDLSEIKANVSQAKSGFAKAKRDYKRAKKLFKDDVATLEQLQDAETAYHVLKEKLKIAEFNKVHSSIVAPADGNILKQMAEENELIGQGMPVFIFGSGNNDWIIRLGVIDRDIIRLQLGDKAVVHVDAYPEVKLHAKVTEIGQAANPVNQTFEVELSITPNKYKLIAGFIARVDIVPSNAKSYHVIPIESIIEADKKSGYIYEPIDSGTRVKKIRVKIAHILRDRLAVSSGLENVERVITEGASYMTEHSVIEIVE